MKKVLTIFLALAVIVLFIGISTDYAKDQGKSKKKSQDKNVEVDCTSIKEGVLTYSEGHFLFGTPLMKGFDPYGYNYQAHIFSGSYANSVPLRITLIINLDRSCTRTGRGGASATNFMNLSALTNSSPIVTSSFPFRIR